MNGIDDGYQRLHQRTGIADLARGDHGRRSQRHRVLRQDAGQGSTEILAMGEVLSGPGEDGQGAHYLVVVQAGQDRKQGLVTAHALRDVILAEAVGLQRSAVTAGLGGVQVVKPPGRLAAHVPGLVRQAGDESHQRVGPRPGYWRD